MSQPGAKRRRPWYQFSLRTLLVIVAVVAGLAFAYVKLVEPYRLQREAMAVITKLGGTYKTEDVTGWVRYLDKDVQNVVVVDLADCDAPSEYLPHLTWLPRLRTVVVGGHAVGHQDLIALGRLASITRLVLDSTWLTDSDVQCLKGLCPDLEVYRSDHRACAEFQKLGATLYGDDSVALPEPLDADVDALSLMGKAVGVTGHNCPITDTTLTWLPNLSLSVLELSLTHVTDEGMAFLERATSVRHAYLNGTRLTDSAVPILARCTHVTHLIVTGTAISPSGIAALRKALPHCIIDS